MGREPINRLSKLRNLKCWPKQMFDLILPAFFDLTRPIILFPFFFWVKKPQESTTLWIGDLDPSWDENFLKSLLPEPEIVQTKLIRDKNTGNSTGFIYIFAIFILSLSVCSFFRFFIVIYPIGYGFLVCRFLLLNFVSFAYWSFLRPLFQEFTTPFAAKKCLEKYSGKMIPGTQKAFKINWATYNSTFPFVSFRFCDPSSSFSKAPRVRMTLLYTSGNCRVKSMK
jgi:hypothetical protein